MITDDLFAPLAGGEGVRIGLVGDSGCGKSHATRTLLAAWLLRQPRGIALVHDDIAACQYPGEQRGFPADLRTHPLTTRTAVFRGRDGMGCDPELVASYGWRLVRAGLPVLLVLDELERAASAGHWRHQPGCPTGASCICELPRAFSWGRRAQLSVIWTTQSPQKAPTEALEQSTALVTFHLAGRGARYLDTMDYLDGRSEIRLSQLPDGLAPRDKRGECVVLRRGASWDGNTYRF